MRKLLSSIFLVLLIGGCTQSYQKCGFIDGENYQSCPEELHCVYGTDCFGACTVGECKSYAEKSESCSDEVPCKDGLNCVEQVCK